MNTELLIQEIKSRFNHNSAKSYLKDKYQSKLIVADQGGLWCADISTITFLSLSKDKKIILLDTFNNPIEVNRKELLEKLTSTYKEVMNEWNSEWLELENKR